MRTAIFLTCLAKSAIVFGGATVSCTEIEFPTYGYSDPDPVPCTGANRYPYFRYDGSEHKSVPRRWKAVVLENAKTRVTILPDIGGKVWGAEDKSTGHEYIYFNHVIKFRNVAMRGPWTAGGIEFNFGIIGHSPNTSTPVDWCVRTNADGSVSYFAGATERICRTFWQVEVRLGRDDDFFTTRSFRFNSSSLPVANYQWMNAAYSARGNPEFFYPGKNYIGHCGDAHAWPVDPAGRDLSRYSGNAFGGAKSYHIINGPNGFFGVWWPDRGFGTYHRNAQYDKFGRKIWLWSLARSGGIWEDLLTDSDGQYMELQSGRGFQQPNDGSEETPFGYPAIAAGASESFVETWGPVHSRDELVRLAETTPGDSTRPTARAHDFASDSAYARYLKGVQRLRSRDRADGVKLLMSALEREPHLLPALDELAFEALERGDDVAARGFAERVLSVDAYDAAANYADALASLSLGDDARAGERLGVAAISPEYRAPAFAWTARLALRRGDWAAAEKAALRALQSDVYNLDAHQALIAAKRRRGDVAAARSAAEKLLAEVPLCQGVRYELFKLGGEDYRSGVACELPEETHIDNAIWYVASGLHEEALELLGYAPETPMALIYAAHVLEGLGRSAEAAQALKAASMRPAAFVFPFRREARAPLKAAVDRDGSWKFRYWMAVYLAAKGEDDASNRLLDSIDDSDEPVFFLYRASRRQGELKRADLERAAAMDDSWRVGFARASHAISEDRWDDATGITADCLRRHPGCNPVEILHARALVGAGRPEECVKFLENVRLLPSEGGGNAYKPWVAALSAMAEKAYARGDAEKGDAYIEKGLASPENLGRGRRFADEDTFLKWPTNMRARAICRAHDAQFGVKDRVRFLISPSGAAAVELSSPGGRALIELVGARVVSWVPAGGREVFFNPVSRPHPSAEWTHGGVPLCWPWFCFNAGRDRQIHGFARSERFLVRKVDVSSANRTVIVLGLESSSDTRALWPFDFDLELRVELDSGLRIALTTRNTGSEPIDVTDGFHPYFLVGERDRCRITGLDGTAYCDARYGSCRFDGRQKGDLPLDADYDHVFASPGKPYAVVDPVLKRKLEIVPKGNTRVIVWNPGPIKPGTLGNLGPDDWRRLITAEPGSTFADQAVRILPGRSHTLEAAMRVLPLK